MQLIFESSRPGRRGIALDTLDVPNATVPEQLRRSAPAALPEVSELDVVRHFTRLSQRNVGVDCRFYPLGSCTMKYNPKMAEAVAALPAFQDLHPHLSTAKIYEPCCQGALAAIYHTEHLLAEIGGMRQVSLQPIAGAHGELTGALLIAAYHRDKGHAHKDTILIPHSAHGTNPASAAIAGFKVVEVPSDKDGTIHFESFERLLNDSVAAVMLTCPNTHGQFEPDVRRIADLAHEADALLYYDGANLNAIVGQCRPGDLGFDVMHFNLHKTFATPHGMGGPGSGPVGVNERLEPFLPGPRVVPRHDRFTLETAPKSIGKIAAFFGNFLIALRAYAYMRCLGSEGLKDVARYAVLHANYVLARLSPTYTPAFPGLCMHECVFTATPQAERGVRALDIAKALIDYGYHPPTIYFPLTVKESIMIEPTETESKETLDAFCDAMLEIAAAVDNNGDALRAAPITTPVGRLDEVRAARELNCACLPE
jgi:glycine dehydrogenase subunit 2